MQTRGQSLRSNGKLDFTSGVSFELTEPGPVKPDIREIEAGLRIELHSWKKIKGPERNSTARP